MSTSSGTGRGDWGQKHQFGADTHPLMGDEDQSSPTSPPTGSSVGADFFSPAVPAASAASAASMTSSPPETSSRSPASGDRDEDEWGENSFDDRASLAFKRLSISESSSELSSFQQLMRQGSWRALADKVKEVRRRSLLEVPDEKLVYTSYHILALMKLRNYAAAQEELSALGDLNSPDFRFEQHPEFYKGKSGSMVPFGLRWLRAELPHRLGQTATTIDRLYDLLAHCNERIDFLNASVQHLSPDEKGATESSDQAPAATHGDSSSLPAEGGQMSHGIGGEEDQGESHSAQPPAPDEAMEAVGSNYVPSDAQEDDDFGDFVTSPLDKEFHGNIVYSTLVHRWKRRQEMVLCAVLGHHLTQKNYVICLNWLEDLIKKRPHDVVVLSKYGYVQLQLGDLYGARRTFAAVESICEQQGRSSNPVFSNLMSRNRGLLYFSLKQYGKAVKEFDAVLESDPGDVVSANNKALCLMYSRDLVGATQVLETVLQRSPITALNETLVLNLCSMYELASMNSVESKKTLSSWILRIAPDDFDPTCTRL